MFKNYFSRVKISKNVIFLSFVSLFNDIASEMVYPVLPIFLTAVLGAPASVVGLIEGIAESLASLLKTYFGRLSDKFGKRKKFVVTGYFLSSFSKLILGLAGSWPVVLLGRSVDRLGKGVRTPARDALINESTDQVSRGRAFGFHRTLDSLGAVIGPLLAILLLKVLNNQLSLIFLIAAIPGFLGVWLLIYAVKEANQSKLATARPRLTLKELNSSFKIFLLISVIFSLGNSSDAFLILRSQNLGLSITATLLAYVLYNFFYSAFSTPAGIASDKIGPRKVLFSGFLIFGLVYLSLGLITKNIFIWPLFAVYGLYIAFTDGVGKAYIASLVPAEKLSTAYGVYQTAVGLCAFFASLLAGLLWSGFGPSAPFFLGSLMALLAAGLFVVLEKKSTAQV